MCGRLGGSRGGAQGIGMTLEGCPIPGGRLQQPRHALGVPVRMNLLLEAELDS